MRKLYNAVIIDFDCISNDLQPTISTLKAQGKRVGIVAKVSRKDVEARLRHELLDVDAVIAKDDAKSFKPNPKALIKAMQSLKSNGRNTVFVGNCLSGAVMAKRIRVDFIGITSPSISSEDYATYDACGIVDAMEEIGAVLE